MSTISNGRLGAFILGSQPWNEEIEQMATELLVLRKERERRILYTAPPAPVHVDESAAQAGIDPAITDAYMQGCHDTEARLTAAPPASVVPDEVLKSLDFLLRRSYFRKWIKDPQGYVAGSIPVRDLVNVALFADTCAAMLKGADDAAS